MKLVMVVRAKPSAPSGRATRAMMTRASQVTALATTTATRAVTGIFNLVWAAASVITPVIVPGLAAKRISGVRDFLEFEAPLGDAGEDPCSLSIRKPIHDNTPPPATMNASSDTPNRCNNCVPTSAATMRMTATLNAAFVASDNISARERLPSIRANMAPQTNGFTSDNTVTMAWRCSFTPSIASVS